MGIKNYTHGRDTSRNMRMWAEGRGGDGLRDGWKAQENEGKLICRSRRKDFPGTKCAPAFHSFILTVNSTELSLQPGV